MHDYDRSRTAAALGAKERKDFLAAGTKVHKSVSELKSALKGLLSKAQSLNSMFNRDEASNAVSALYRAEKDLADAGFLKEVEKALDIIEKSSLGK